MCVVNHMDPHTDIMLNMLKYYTFSGYWESLLQQLKAFIARAQLKERHQQKLREKLAELKKQVCKLCNSSLKESVIIRITR